MIRYAVLNVANNSGYLALSESVLDVVKHGGGEGGIKLTAMNWVIDDVFRALHFQASKACCSPLTILDQLPPRNLSLLTVPISKEK